MREVERYVLAAESLIEDEAHDLFEIGVEYAAAARSGRFGERRIRPEQARQYAAEFRAKSDALYKIAPLVAAALRTLPHPKEPI